ncbi:Na+/H+ antiporter subunit E [Rheinheimera sp.]|uniref:Na+/H+ antiporter subunit E n=1 Tax=Rheinheimera sp. TaxID=1869214 RepID=UPI002FDD5EF4
MKFISVLLPTPARSLLLFVVWLLLNNSVAPIHLIVAAVLAVLIPQLTAPFRDPQPPIRRWGLALRYIGRVLLDIVLANLQVIKLVLGPNKNLNPGFVLVPLSMTEALPLTILAGTVSLTPGTVSAEILPYQLDENSAKPKYLLLHVLDLHDEAELIASIKQRYEQPLKEIFQC